MDQLQMWRLNIQLGIGLLVFLVIFVLLAIAVWTGLRVWLARTEKKREEAAEHQRKYRPDGTPFPPATEGFCDQCGGAFPKVYHVHDGPRLCPACYEASFGGLTSPQPADTPGTEHA
jgi:hypothetical protein